MPVDSVTHVKADFNEEDKRDIHLQLERLLSDPHFSHSRRFPSFLRYIVEQTVAGEGENLKERSLGMHIFGRAADYDTASDPIVRVTAAEIRKRIAQYYQDPGHEHELRILLPTGAYMPQFRWPERESDASETSAPSTELPEEISTSTADSMPAPERLFKKPRRVASILCAVLIAICAVTAIYWKETQRSAYAFFWGPVVHSDNPVLFCIADQSQYSEIALRDAADPTHQVILPDNLTAIVMDDVRPLVRIAGLLQSDGKKYGLKSENATSLMDLQNGPTVFIGAFDNAWTLRLTAPLRYHFANNAEMTHFSVVDSKTPQKTNWTVDRLQQLATNNYIDYAIVARFTDSDTGRLAIVAAGVGRGGTIAAGRFLTNPTDLAELQQAARAAGSKKNIEVVLSTQIIGGEPSPPKMLAAYFW